MLQHSFDRQGNVTLDVSFSIEYKSFFLFVMSFYFNASSTFSFRCMCDRPPLDMNRNDRPSEFAQSVSPFHSFPLFDKFSPIPSSITK
jgi:hypothetical protein